MARFKITAYYGVQVIRRTVYGTEENARAYAQKIFSRADRIKVDRR